MERVVAYLVEELARRRHQVSLLAEVMADNYEQIYSQLADMYRKGQGTAVRPKRTIHDVALAREAARQWHRVPEGDRFNTRATTPGSVLKLFVENNERDPTDKKTSTLVAGLED